MNHILASPPTAVTTAASHERMTKESASKDVRENVVHPGATSTAFPQTLLSIAIVKVSLLRVCQYFIGKADFFELN